MINSVANAASYTAGVVSPGEMVVIFGNGLGPAQIGGLALNSSGLVSTQYSTNASIGVQFNGFAAPLIYTSSTAIAAVVPYEIAGSSTAQVTVTYQGKTSAPVTVSVAAAVPGIFTANASGVGQAAAVNNYETGTLKFRAAAGGARKHHHLVRDRRRADFAGRGGRKAGGGSASHADPSGKVDHRGRAGRGAVRRRSYGEVAGMLQINVVVPSTVSGSAVPVVVQVGNAVSQAGVTDGGGTSNFTQFLAGRERMCCIIKNTHPHDP